MVRSPIFVYPPPAILGNILENRRLDHESRFFERVFAITGS